jgi:hypothetical protein
MLPALGPRPTLKGEEMLTLRLMEDVTIPRPGAQYNSRDWRPSASSYKPAIYYNDAREFHARPAASAVAATRDVISVDGGYQPVSQKVEVPADAQPSIQPAVQTLMTPSGAMTAPRHQTPSSSLTLIALRNETIYAVANYWLDGDNLDYILPSGAQSSCALNDVDLARTTQLNSERGINVSFHEAPAAQPSVAMSSALN